MDAKQYAWLYLVEHGLAEVSQSYYGGYELSEAAQKRFPKANRWSADELHKMRDSYKKDIKKFGVDWDKTRSPDSDMVSTFAGTFAEHSNTKETMVGTLVLKNGAKQSWMADAIEISNVFEMMAQAEAAKVSFEKIFGKNGAK